MATQIGVKIGIEGEKEYRAALKQISAESKNLDAALEKTVSEFSKNTSAMTKNSAIAKNLVQQIENQSQKVQVLNQLVEQSAEKFGTAASQTQAWQRALDSATANLNTMKANLQSMNGAEGFSQISTQIADFGQKMQNIGQSFQSFGTKMTAAVTLPLAAAGTAAVGLASDMTEASSKVDVIFGSMSESVKSFADTSLEQFGISNVKAMQMVGTFGAMATQMGISDRQAAEMAQTLTGLSGDLAAFHNSEVDITSSALEGVFTGQTKALTQFAGAINQANLEEFAAKQGKVYSKMTEGEKVMARYQLVLERTKDAQGNFAATGGETAGSIMKFKGAIQELGVAFGEQLLPVITPIIQGITALVQSLTELPQPVQKAIAVFALVAAAVGPVSLVFGSLTKSFGKIIEKTPDLISALSKIGPAIETLALALNMTVPQFLLLAAAIAAVVAIGIAIASNWDEISAAADRMGSAIGDALNSIGSAMANIGASLADWANGVAESFAELPSKIAKVFKRSVEKIADLFDQMVSSAKESGRHFIEGFVDGITSTVQKVIDAVKDIAKTVQDFLGFSRPDKGPLHEYEEWMPHFMQGLAAGINKNKGLVTKAVNSLAKDMVLPLDASANMNLALAGADGGSYAADMFGSTTNVYVDHIEDLQDLVRIQNQAQQRSRMGVR